MGKFSHEMGKFSLNFNPHGDIPEQTVDLDEKSSPCGDFCTTKSQHSDLLSSCYFAE